VVSTSSDNTAWPLCCGPFLTPTGGLATTIRVLRGDKNPANLENVLRGYSNQRRWQYQTELFAGLPFAAGEDLRALDPSTWTTRVESVPARWPSGDIRLVTFAEAWARSARPNVEEMVIRVIVRGEDPEWDQILADEFTHIVEVDRQLEDFIGSAARADIEETLLAEDGVIATSGEDREWLYLSAPGLTADQMMVLVRRVVDRLSKEHQAG